LFEKPSDIRSADLRDYDPQTRPFEMKSNKIQSVKDYSPPTFWRWIPHNLRPLRTATLADRPPFKIMPINITRHLTQLYIDHTLT
jgi:hypothetical protein